MLKYFRKWRTRTWWAACWVCWASSAGAASFLAQWDFSNNFTESGGGITLGQAFSPPATKVSSVFTNSTIAGEAAQVVAFGRGTYYRATHRLGANGGGSLLNRYSLLMDVRFDTRTPGFTSLLQTTLANSDDGDWFLNAAGGIGISGIYGGLVSDGEWHRLVLTVDATAGVLTSYVDGLRVQGLTSGVTLDGRFALGPTVLFFADENRETSGGMVNSIQLRADVLSEAQVLAFGGAQAAGLPRILPTGVKLLAPNGGERITAGQNLVIRWTAENPVGSVQLQLYQGTTLKVELGNTALDAFQATVPIDRYQGDGSDYRVRLVPSADANQSDFSDDFFVIEGTAPLNPKYGTDLQRDGGFEESLAQWTIKAGVPEVLAAGQGKGNPHSGSRFLHGGRATSAPESIVTQLIDLNAAGFSDAELDDRSNLSVDGWLRNRYESGIFDDQVYYQVRYLDRAGQELGSLRSILPATGVWARLRASGLLPRGTRQLSLEVVGKHRRDPDNDSMADDLVVRLTRPTTAPRVPRITKLPMLQDYRTNAMTLLWETDGNEVNHSVRWGVNDVSENTERKVSTLQIDSTHFVHRATLTGLQAESRYRYQVQSGSLLSGVYSFQTAPRPESPFAVAWWGDNHDGVVTLKTHVANLLRHSPNLICVAGDMVNSGNSLAEWHDYWFKPLEHLNAAQTTPVLYARGNHDGEHALAYAYSTLPGNEAWFSFAYGNSWFIFLDTEVDSTSIPEQLTWLRAELQRPEVQRAAFRIVCFHRPPWTDFWNGGGYTGETWVRDLWTPVLAQYGVDLVISGHTHAYCRGVNQGVMYVVSGGGGGTVDTERVATWPMFKVEYTDTHFDLMEVVGLNLDWQMYNARNELMDEFRLHSRTPELALGEVQAGATSVPLVLTGRSALKYVLERSTDLTTWSAFATNAIPAAPQSTVTNQVPVIRSKEFLRARLF